MKMTGYFLTTIENGEFQGDFWSEGETRQRICASLSNGYPMKPDIAARLSIRLYIVH
jgi:hypothetical protein